ncbi:hypothetical protein POM88_030947 [Heracleum sosnowskyi]|uniref:Uncharacterized protein n=1 Tax=Heracleum sosnowskyi TaxID=360622 RepID=A0AAD8HWG6_9APIA|nr:hypothetical protein POM88_030947 [Heracleum sosnowskyi]
MGHGIYNTDDIKNRDMMLDIATLLSKERKLCDSWSDLKDAAASKVSEKCTSTPGNCDHFSKDFGSFLGLCLSDLKTRPTPMQALDQAFLKDSMSGEGMINSLLCEGSIAN